MSCMHWLSSSTHDLRFNTRKNISLAQQMQHIYICSFSIIRSLVNLFQVKWSSKILGKLLISKNMFYTRGSIGNGFGAKQIGRVILSWCLALSHCARPRDSSTVYLNSVCCKNFHDQNQHMPTWWKMLSPNMLSPNMKKEIYMIFNLHR